MNPAQKRNHNRLGAASAPAQSVQASRPAPALAQRWPQTAWWMGLLGMLLGALVAYGLAALLQPLGAWAAPLAAVTGLILGSLPPALTLLTWARSLGAGPGLAGQAGHLGPAATGLARPLFMDLAHREWARARRYGSGAALVLIDVDRHARLCEARGAHAGDAVLAELLRLTAPTLRPADILTRYSQTQMAVLLAQADATGALDVAERIRERAEQLQVPLDSAHAPTQRLRITVSAGVAHLRPAHLSLQALVDDAEDAVAAARQAGGNCVRAAPLDAARSRSGDAGRTERRAQRKQGGPV